jgi:hypothetical protein
MKKKKIPAYCRNRTLVVQHILSYSQSNSQLVADDVWFRSLSSRYQFPRGKQGSGPSGGYSLNHVFVAESGGQTGTRSFGRGDSATIQVRIIDI